MGLFDNLKDQLSDAVGLDGDQIVEATEQVAEVTHNIADTAGSIQDAREAFSGE